MAALTAVQRLLVQGVKSLAEYVPVLAGGVANAFQIPALDANGLLPVTMMPTGIGPDTEQMPASEALSAGALVNVYANGGVATARNADGSTTGKQADGFVLAAVAAGGTATVFLSGLNTALAGLTPGLGFLSDTAVGAVAAAGATAAGHTFQQVGVVTQAGHLQFDPQVPVTRA
ncbi:hypothetical protein MKK75_27110 [Methylobacterium sp. J-030]|uniref:hypothetical protein n=1 Tax=Methylobacterium sp. J-030 TaxID=2836627 RepID=UPI001FB8EFF5|nr:hypothetical protein [Methylobacterium sp. J-030]MCJ2072418.1 hypothetical protein [Methylobacterium sp. J-030]